MAKKCPTGKVRSGSRCVNSQNPFKPKDQLTQGFLWTTVGAIILSALIGASFLVLGTFGETTQKILLTTLILGISSLFSLVSGNNSNQSIKYAGIGTALVSGLIWISFVWNAFNFDNEFILRFVIITTVIGFALAHSTILKGRNKNQLTKSVYWIVIGLISVVTLMLVYLVFLDNPGVVGMTYYRILGALAILDVAGTITLPILRRVR